MFDPDADLVLHRRRWLPAHPNGMVFRAFGSDGAVLVERTCYSVGGGFVVDEAASGADRVVLDDTPLPLPFTTGGQLLEHCRREGMSISDVMLVNEQVWRGEAGVRAGMLHLWSVMQACVESGCSREGVLPGGLKVPRRAPGLQLRGTGHVIPLVLVPLWVCPD